MLRSSLFLFCLAQLGCGHVFETSVPNLDGDDGTGGGGAGGAGGAPSTTSSTSRASSSTSSTSTPTSTGFGGGGGSAPEPFFLHSVFVTDKQGNGLDSVPVIVYDASNAFVSSNLTAWGIANVEVPSGGALTVAYTNDQAVNLETFLSLPDAGDILLTTDIDTSQPPAVHPVTTYYIVGQGAPLGTTSYAFYGTCDSQVSPSSAQKLYNTACTDLGKQSFVVVALNAAGNGLAWGALNNVATAPGLAVDYAVSLSHADFVDFDLAIKNIPVGASASLKIAPTIYGTVTPSFYTYANPAAGELHLLGSSPASLGADLDLTVQVAEVVFNGSRIFSQTRRYTVPRALDTFSPDLWAAVTVNPLDLSDPAAPVLTWQAGPGEVGDIGTAELVWINGTSSSRQRVSFPSDHPPSIQLPALPPELQAWAKPSGVAYAYTRVTYTEHDTASGYADVLAGVPTGLGQGTSLTSGLYYESPAP